MTGAATATTDGDAAAPRQHPKRWNVGGARELRRQDALRRQREARRDLTDRVRSLVLTAMQKEPEEEEKGQQQLQQQQQHTAGTAMDESMAVDGQQGQHGQRQRQRPRPLGLFASQLCIPEWMVEVPPDLRDSWFVMARPEGKRCLLVASGGTTVSRLLNGAVLHRFESPLPNGSPKSPGPPNGYTLLDTIYDDRTRTYWMLDLLVWRSTEFFDCSAEFRLFFLRSKFLEDLEPLGASYNSALPDPWPFKMRPLLYHKSDAESLRRAYQGYTPFVIDGLLFMHTQGYYGAGPPSPLAVLFKDAATSRYLTAHPLSCVLAVRSSEQGGFYELSTLEGLVVGRAAAAEVEGAWGMGPSQQQDEQDQQEEAAAASRLARFRYDLAREQEQEQEQEQQEQQEQQEGGPLVVPMAMVEGLRFEKLCPAAAAADPWSKILLKSRARLQGQQGQPQAVSFDDLLRAAEDGMES